MKNKNNVINIIKLNSSNKKIYVINPITFIVIEIKNDSFILYTLKFLFNNK